MGTFDRDKSIGKIAERENLRMVLTKYGIDVNAFGRGTAKTLEDLLEEIQSGETTLVEHKGQLLRLVRFAGIDIYYHDGQHEYLLVEDKQVFNDGRERKRNVGFSVSEKMLLNEKPKQAAKRGLTEELSSIPSVDTIKLKGRGKRDEILQSPSYPGVNSKYERFGFEGRLTANQFNPHGYMATEAKKTTFFVWQQIK